MTMTNDPISHSPKAFVDYYNSRNIIPVRQDLTNIERFIFRRNYLYKTLGLPLRQIRNLNVIEFGPGGGFNAVATSYFGPQSYVFVDATFASISELRRKQVTGDIRAQSVEIVESDIFNYCDDRKYEVVICEGVIPGQSDPEKMLQHVGSFCTRGGILIVTTTSAASMLSEVCRRVLRPLIMSSDRTFLEQTAFAASLFKNHLANLATSTRPVDDWVQDVILHDWHLGKYVFTMVDSLEALKDNFEFYSSSPRFLLDDRWYKQIDYSSLSLNELLREQYPSASSFFIDFRIPLSRILQTGDATRLSLVEPLCYSACVVHEKILQENSFEKLEDFVAILKELANVLPDEFSPTKLSILDFIHGIRSVAMGEEKADFGSFEKWWGRGQQYLSVTNKDF